ncbi:hypothetical protein EBT25_17770, partial [bacterium]|nr:hypothetical protein [bacterium]
VINQDAAAFLDKFETAINTKVAAKLDAMYPEVAHAVMNPQAEAQAVEAPAEPAVAEAPATE